MKFSTKLAVATAMTVASAASIAATLPTSGDGSAVVNVFSTNDSTPFSYSFDTGQLFSGLSTAALNTPGTTLTFTLTGLTADLATAAGVAAVANGLVFDVSAASTTGSIATVGAFKLETTAEASVTLAAIAATTSGALANTNAQNNQFLTNLATNPAFTTNTTDAFYANANYNDTYNNLTFKVAGDTSEALPFYLLTSNRATVSTVQAPAVYAGTWAIDLAAGTLTYTVAGGTPVPLPPSVWLLVSGLAGVAVLGRRRKSDGPAALPA